MVFGVFGKDFTAFFKNALSLRQNVKAFSSKCQSVFIGVLWG